MVTVPLFRRLLGPDIDALPPSLLAAADSAQDQRWTGSAEIEAGRNPLARLLCRMMRLPAPESDVPVTVTFQRRGQGERWVRDFAGRRHESTLSERRSLMAERMGSATNIFRVSVVTGNSGSTWSASASLTSRCPRCFGRIAVPASASRTETD